MKNLSIVLCFPIFIGCNFSTPPKEEAVSVPISKFVYNPLTTKVSWTAYKFIDKVGVEGFLDSVIISNTIKSSNPVSVFMDASFILYTNSVNSNNPIRDQKIISHFFGSMTNADEISGKVKHLGPDSSFVTLKINGIEKNVPVVFTSRGKNVTLIGEINIHDWNASQSLSRLNKACELEHTGGNRKSLLWPNIKIKVTTTLEKVAVVN